MADEEKRSEPTGMPTTLAGEKSTTMTDIEDEKQLGMFRKVTQFLLRWGIETHGISPIPTEKRIDRRIHQMFFIWFSVNFNILAFGTGSSGPAFFALGLHRTGNDDALMTVLRPIFHVVF
ncbi:hypothetical protein BYT27DRAFT_7340140 [Phlegmacium glaucopus]|nr:hypothetical protein BYT27DRAFT_7340140 [Phlegmacium glaucopus]